MTKRGRPPSTNPRRNVRSVHLTDDELTNITQAAEQDRKPVTAWIRQAAVEKAKRANRRR